MLLVVDWRGYKGDSFKSIVQSVSFNLYLLFPENNFSIVYTSSNTFYPIYSSNVPWRSRIKEENLYTFPSNPILETFYREGKRIKKERGRKRWEENVRLLINWRKERDILPRSKLHYKPLNLIFSLHSHEV